MQTSSLDEYAIYDDEPTMKGLVQYISSFWPRKIRCIYAIYKWYNNKQLKVENHDYEIKDLMKCSLLIRITIIRKTRI